MTSILINIILALFAVIGVGGGLFVSSAQKKKADREKQIAQKYKTQRDESRATARILVEHQDAVKNVRKVGAKLIKDIQDAKTEDDSIDIIARLTSDWNAGL